MMRHKIGFYGDIWPIIPKLFQLPLLIWSTGFISKVKQNEPAKTDCQSEFDQTNT